MTIRPKHLLSLSLIAAIVLSACASTVAPTATPIPEPTRPPATAATIVLPPGPQPVIPSTPTASPVPRTTSAPPPPTPTPLPKFVLPFQPAVDGANAPRVLLSNFGNGEQIDPTAAIEVSFDRDMDKASVESALVTQPKTDGAVAWKNARTLSFKPANALQRGSMLDLGINQSAKDASGQRLREPFSVRVVAQGSLQVLQTIPANNDQDVHPDTILTIMFNRPVVALTTVSQNAPQPNPLRIEPALDGQYEWLNTSVLVFKPAAALPGGTRFIAKIDGNLKDTDGIPMDSEYAWSFGSSTPKVLIVSPEDGGTSEQAGTIKPGSDMRVPMPGFPDNRTRLVKVDSVVKVTFNQSIDAASAQSNFALLDAKNSPVPGAFAVISQTLTFTPSQRLQFGAQYTISVKPGVLSASGGLAGKEDFRSLFKTYPLPEIIRTEPADGAKDAGPQGMFQIIFNAPVDQDTIMRNLSISPAVSVTGLFSKIDRDNNYILLNLATEPATDYTIEIKPGIQDSFGNVIERGKTVKFRTGNLPPQARLLVNKNIIMHPAGDSARFVMVSNNVGKVDLELYKFEIADSNGQLFFNPDQPAPGRQIRKWSVPISGDTNKIIHSEVTLTEGEAKLAPGLYHLRMTSPDFPKDEQIWRMQIVTLIVTELNVVMKNDKNSTLIWTTDLATGAPVSGVNFKLYELRNRGEQKLKLLELGNGTSAADGVTKIAGKYDPNTAEFFAISQNPFALVSNEFSSFGGGVSMMRGRRGFPGPDQMNEDASAFTIEGERGFIYTDRALYRAGQKVFMKGWVRSDDDVRYAPPVAKSVNLIINNPRGQPVLQKTLTLDAWGGFDAEFALPESAGLGLYHVMISPPSKAPLATAQFTMAAYRPPEFEVSVSTNISGNQVVRGSLVEATLAAKYLSGGSMANATMSWNVLATRDSFNPPQLDEYSFEDGAASVLPYHEVFSGQPSEPIFRGADRTDAQGNLVIRIPISREIGFISYEGFDGSHMPKPTPYSGTLSYNIEGNATGSDNQQIAGRARMQVHPAHFYAGVKFESSLAEAGKVVTANLITVDWNGKRLSGKSIDATLIRREWKNDFDPLARSWNNTPSDEIITTKTAESDARGEAVLNFTPAKPGSYRVQTRVKDEAGRVQQSSTELWVSGNDYATWFRSSNNEINLISNKTEYIAGETAQILIPSPFKGEHYALMTVERERVIQHEVIKLSSNSTVYKIPIGNEHAPNIFVSAALVQAGTKDKPAALLGSLELAVAPLTQKLNVTVSTDAKQAQPGQTISYTLTVLDSAGKPVQGSFALDLVDKGILNLRPRVDAAILKVFYGPRTHEVRTANLLGFLNSSVNFSAQQRAGGGGPGAMVLSAPAPARAGPMDASATKAMNNSATENMAGPAENAPALRENFADTGFWAPAINTDANGKAEIALKLPDNLTTWVLRAVGLDAATRVGEGLQDVQTRKPIMVRPITPRFLVAGDVIELGAIVQNSTDTPAQVSVALLESKGLSMTSAITQSINVPGKGEAVASWIALALDVPQVDVVFDARSSIGNDASRPRLSTAPKGGLKVNRYVTEETVGTAGMLDKAGSRTELIVLPPNLTARTAVEVGTLTIRTDTSLVGALQPGLKYLDEYAYESAEAISSRFLPNVLTFALLKEFGQPADAKAQAFINEQLQKIYGLQNSDGGWGWYRERESNPHTSFYVLFSLLRAKNAGFIVRQNVIEQATRYVKLTLRNTSDLREPQAFNQQAYALYVLAEADATNSTRLTELFDKRDLLDIHAKALLIMALGKTSKADPRIKTLFADLNAKVQQSATGAHWEEAATDFWAMNSDTRSTALVLMANALYDSANPIAANAMRWLLADRNADGTWKSTYETSWVMIALTEWARATGDLKANYEFGTSLNNKELAKSKASPEVNRQSSLITRPLMELLQDQANKLIFTRGEGDGRLYYTAHMRSFLPVSDVKALDRGIRVQRRYVNADCKNGIKCPTINSAKIGDVVRVELSLIAPSNLSYVQLEDFIPAGAELVDTGLATTSQLASAGSLSRDGQEEAPFARFAYWRSWWNWYTRAELKDDRVAVFAPYLGKGSYSYSYTFRTTNAGTFNVIPAYASEQYFPEVFGRSAGAGFGVTR